tara:strand:+ start:143 stop:829 length:687 start_codon:yes stop_codon:yes gene_type:complete
MFLINSFVYSSAPSWSNTKSILTDGVDDYVDCGTLGSLSGTSFTVSAWAKANTSGVNDAIVSTRINGLGSSRGFDLYLVDGAGTLYARVYNGAGLFAQISTTISLATWYNFVLVYSSGTAELFVNGVSVGTGAVTYADSASTFSIGRHRTSGFFDGNIDEVAVWNSDQSANVSTIYNSGTPQDLASLTPQNYWRCGDGDTFPTLTDNAGSNNGTMTNMTSGDIVADVP